MGIEYFKGLAQIVEMLDPYDKSDAEKAEAIAKGVPSKDGTRCPQCGVSFAPWVIGKECRESPHEWHRQPPNEGEMYKYPCCQEQGKLT